MIDVCGVKFSEKSRVYYFEKSDLAVFNSCNVVVDTERGEQIGEVVIDSKIIDRNTLVTPLKKIIRIANKYDLKQSKNNIKDSLKALDKARYLVDELNLNMNILDASYTLDRNQLLFNFISDERVDFRELAKRLASIYKTRIELRQIGIRDKAREVGGLGPCGRFLCCNTFLTDINSVTINMAKNQSLALNPTKINGVCGRLLCCLSYEDETYKELKKGLPSIGDEYFYNDKKYEVESIDILKRTITIVSENSKEVIKL